MHARIPKGLPGGAALVQGQSDFPEKLITVSVAILDRGQGRFNLKLLFDKLLVRAGVFLFEALDPGEPAIDEFQPRGVGTPAGAFEVELQNVSSSANTDIAFSISPSQGATEVSYLERASSRFFTDDIRRSMVSEEPLRRLRISEVHSIR